MRNFLFFSIFWGVIQSSCSAEVKIWEEEVSSEIFSQTVKDLTEKYLCDYDQTKDNYQFLLSVLDIESSKLDDLSNSDILSSDSLKFIDELMLAKSRVDNTLTKPLCIKGEKAFVLFQYKWSAKNNDVGYGIASVVVYEFVKEGGSLKLLLPQKETEDTYWYSMGDGVDSHVFHEIRIANKPLKQDK
jgi:hypothetical protein